MKRAAIHLGRLFKFVTVFGFSFACVIAGAEAQSDQDLMSMNLEDLTRVKVYSASRHLEDIKKAPSSVSIITAEDIRRYGWRTLGEALRSLPGFYTSNDRLYSYLGIRGFLRPGDYNSRILLLINGHRLNDNVYDTAGMGTEFPLDLELIDHIEVVRGPGSSLYGTNAVFGVINVITRRPGPDSVVETAGDAGTLLSRTERMTALVSEGDLTAVLSASRYRSAGQAKLFFPEFASPQTNNGYALDMDGSHFEQAYVDLSYRHFRLQGLIADRIKKFPTGNSGTVFNDPADRIEDVRGYVDIGFQQSLSTKTDLDVRAYYDAYGYVGGGAFADAGPTSRTLVFEKARANWIGAEVNLTRQIGKQRITAGGDYEYSISVLQRAFFAGQPDAVHLDRSPWLSALYSEAELNLVPKLIIHAGARIDWFNTFGHALSPRFALIYSPDSRTAIKYILGTAFRAPNAYEGYYADGVTIIRGPKSLSPERILSNDLIVERSFTPWLSVTADGYYNRLEKLIDEVPDSNSGLTYFVNDGSVHGKGLELEVKAERSPGFAARASYTLSSTVDEVDHERLENSPSSQVKLNGALPATRWAGASLELLRVSAMSDYQGTRVPSYFLPNATISSSPLWRRWELSASCYNLTNHRWSGPMGPTDPEDQIKQDGRTFRVKISYRLPVHGSRRDK